MLFKKIQSSPISTNSDLSCSSYPVACTLFGRYFSIVLPFVWFLPLRRTTDLLTKLAPAADVNRYPRHKSDQNYLHLDSERRQISFLCFQSKHGINQKFPIPFQATINIIKIYLRLYKINTITSSNPISKPCNFGITPGSVAKRLLRLNSSHPQTVSKVVYIAQSKIYKITKFHYWYIACLFNLSPVRILQIVPSKFVNDIRKMKTQAEQSFKNEKYIIPTSLCWFQQR